MTQTQEMVRTPRLVVPQVHEYTSIAIERNGTSTKVVENMYLGQR